MHKEQVESILAQHLSELLPDDPDRVAALAAQFAFLLEGAMARAGLEGSSARMVMARTMVRDILKAL
ncbi:hypothetical protein [Pontibaca salina]|uniref:Uncharacterized protein n=1 Tax=Pontibaca salina TaxID=2795731 RepID=A0A934M1C2_9RHOB|nr:hypothetical protein [Pontibaca salina]MBI6630895.1 hypothetical protein [Pontibaca salina]